MNHLTRLSALLASTALPIMLAVLADPASAQAQSTPPEHYTLDARGVDLTSGQFVYAVDEVSIGAGEGRLSRGRLDYGPSWSDLAFATVDCSIPSCTVVADGASEAFDFDFPTGTYAPSENTGSKLVRYGAWPNYSYAYTKANGETWNFEPQPITVSELSGVPVVSRTRPNGVKISFHYGTFRFCIWRDDNEQCLGYADGARLQSYSNNLGYQIHYQYAAPAGDYERDFLIIEKVIGINTAVDYCAPTDNVCSGLTRTWPSATYGYSQGGETVTDQSGRQTTYGRSANGLFTIRFPGSVADDVTIDRDAGGLVTGITDAGGAWTYDYAVSGSTLTTTATGPLGQGLTAVTDLNIGRATAITDALNNSWSYQYNAGRRLSRITNPGGDHTDFAYDARGNVTQTTRVAKTGSGLSDITTSATFPASCANDITCNSPITTTDARGNVTDYTWASSHGGLLTVTAPAPATGADRPQTRYGYAAQTAWYKNSAGVIVAAPTAVTLPVQVSACATGTSCAGGSNEVRTTLAYGTSGVANTLLATSVSQGSGVDPAMAVTTVTHTADGDVETVDGPLYGAVDTTRYIHDDARQVIGVVGPDPDGAGAGLNRARRMTYNARGQVTLAETGTASGGVWANFSPLLRTETVYDSAAYSRLVETRQQSAAGVSAGVQQVSYDAAGRPSCTAVRMNPATYGALPASACTAATAGSDGPDRIAQVAYDVLGRPLSTTTALGLPEAITESVTYTANGQVAAMTDGEGNVSVMAYDGFDRLARTDYPSAVVGGGPDTADHEAWTHDPADNLLSSTNRAGQTTYFSYDALNRADTLYAPAGTASVSYAYDNLGRPISTTSDGRTVSTVYDALSRPTAEITSEFGSVLSAYDPAGRRTRLTWPDGAYVDYGWDLYDGLSTVTSSLGGPLAGYAYDDLGQRTGVTRPNGVSTLYGYDAVSRLASISHDLPGTGPDLTLGYSHNPAGQIVQRTVSNDSWLYDAPTQVTDYANNGKNQLTGINGAPVTYDAAANLATGDGATYGYDALNRLTTADPSGAGSATLQYDPVGRLMRTIDGANTRFFYDGLQAIGEVDATGTLLRRYVPGAAMDETAVGWDGAVAWPLTDERGSVIGQTYADGTVSINRYDEYGVPSAGNVGRFQYTGQMWLPEGGVYHYRARAYAPQLGRFLQTDPIGYAAGANLYAYVGGDPVNLVDPLGLYRCLASAQAQVCRRVREALALLKEAEERYEEGSSERNAIRAIIRLYGREGERNGVTIVEEQRDPGRPARATGERGSSTVWLDPSQIGGSARLASILGHEGVHAGYYMAGRGPPRESTRTTWEIPAYVVGFRIDQALGNGIFAAPMNASEFWNLVLERARQR